DKLASRQSGQINKMIGAAQPVRGKFPLDPFAKLHADPLSPIMFDEQELAILHGLGDFSKYAIILRKIFVQRLSAPKCRSTRPQPQSGAAPHPLAGVHRLISDR